MSEYQTDVDVSSGQFTVDVDLAGNPTPAGQRWLNGYELSLANRDRWDRLYEMEAENSVFETGYDYAVQVYETVSYKIEHQQIASTRTTTTADGEQVYGAAGDSQESYTYESAESRAEWDTQAYRDMVHQSEIERTRQETDDGLDVAPTISDVDEVLAEDPPSQTGLLTDPSYIRVVNGWNQKLNATSKDLSGLVPFCELYAVFDQSDIISQEDEFSTRYTSIKNRMIKVKFTGSKRAEGTNSEPPLPAGLSKDCYIVKVAGDNKSQLQSDSGELDKEWAAAGVDLIAPTTSYKGLPGIGDLAVSRGSAAAQNVKYDLSITLPNPELINERFEYSKLMLMNSPFLIVYGWNIKDSNFNAEYYPPRISTMPGITNEIVVGDGIGGFWSSAIINLSNFSFSFDTVGHLIGKLTFLNSSGIFLGTLSTAAVGQAMLDQISTPSEEVIRRTGGEENQDFIWQNGVPWSATVPDTEQANIENNREGQRRILTSFFDLENNIGNAATDLLEESLLEQNITIEVANQIRDNMEKLLQMGEHFLQRYRVWFINQLFERRKRGLGLDSEKASFQLIIDDTNWKGGQKSWSIRGRDSGVGDRGERYGPDGDEDNNSAESDAIIDDHFQYYITAAWNTFFKYRFENMRKDDILGRISIGDRSLPMPVIPKVQFPGGASDVPAGQTQSQFDHFATNGGRTKQITYQIPAGSRAKLLPVALENVINWAAEASGRFDQEDSFIKSMPPFGRELQRIIANDFRDTTNVNYNNFYNPASRKVTEEVLNLIETTSVVSVPVPVSEEDRVSLSVEKRSYSEVFGIDPSDGSKASVPLSKDVMIGFEFLNEVATGGKTLSKITFYSNDIFTSLQDTVFDDWLASEEAQVFADSFASPAARLAAIAAQSDSLVALHGNDSFYSPLYKVVADTRLTYYQGRFPARRYAVLKNGWIVSQTRATENDPWKDHGAPQALVVNGEPSGLWFLKGILPEAAVSITGEDLREGKSSEETYIYNAQQRIKAIEAKKDELRNDYNNNNAEQNAAEYAQEELANLILNLNAVRGIVGLQNAMISASRGSIIMDQVDMGIANQEQAVIEGEDGESRHTIFRLPVYFFLGSVLESLRVATNDKVKFFYSEVPSSKAAEPFYINIPESSANSVDNYYDAQIANFDRQLEALGAAGWREEEDEDGEIRMVEGGPTLPERQATELLASQTRWDNFLVDFIKKVGQDYANLWNYLWSDGTRSRNDRVIGGTYPHGRGVYLNYTNMYGTNVKTQVRWPNYQYHRSDQYYEDYDDHKFDSDGNIHIWLPWVYRLGNQGDYWKGPDGKYEHNPNIGEDKHGFMRMWRPDDLNEIIGYAARGNNIYYRDAQREQTDTGQFHVSHHQAFYTDSFGQNQTTDRGRQRVDYGYSDAYNREGDWRDKNAQPNRSFNAEITNGYHAAAGVLNWLNWWSPDRGRYPHLDSVSHRTFGNTTNRLNKWSPPQLPGDRETDPENWRTRTAANLAKEWYEIQWPMERERDSANTTEPMWVRGRVVQEFIQLNGTRPTQDIPAPNPGDDPQEVQQQRAQIDTLKAQIRALESKKENGDLDAQFKRLPIRTTYEIPVNISTIKQFLTSEPRAPLHKLLKKVVAATKETVPAIQLSMRPAAANSSYLDIFPSAMNYDGVIQEIFTEVEVGSLSTDASDTMGIKDARRSVSKGRFAQSEKVMVCQFGTSQSLVESFGLASKIDPNAFSAFRLPAVVGGATMNVIEVLRNARDGNPNAYSTLLSDFGSILSDGIITGKDALKKLKIVNDGTEGASTVNYDNLEAFLLSESPAISKAASTLLEDMMSQNVKLYNTILTMQNEFFTNKMKNEEGTIGEPGPRQAGSKFYGNILSTFLRTATLTIHGTTGLSVFNLVYLKGLLSGIEGLYLISSVNESIAASTFTTTLECKLIEYTNNDPKTNPIAYRGASNLNRLASLIDEAKANEEAEFGTHYGWNRLGDVVEQIDNRNGVFD